ncbi:restriction endonuclease [Flavobacterium sp.]|uniref:restriction endonuclease n=1 Tax=Flavobacterium sp. TaxID=239 RepID=UPI003529BDE5
MISKNNKTPLHEITDGNYFQQIVAEYFRSLKREKQDFHIADIDVDDTGIGCDNGCDILVDFHFEDTIGKHTHRWVVECKSQKRAVGTRDINSANLNLILNSKDADGYLLVCVSDASSSLKQLLNGNKKVKSVVWNGAQLWHKFTVSESLLKSFFPKYYHEYFIQNKAKENFENAFTQFEKQIES